jgi:hypothetical protein
MRKRTFEDRKFSQGDANSDAYKANWERMFGTDTERNAASDLGVTDGETSDSGESSAQVSK